MDKASKSGKVEWTAIIHMPDRAPVEGVVVGVRRESFAMEFAAVDAPLLPIASKHTVELRGSGPPARIDAYVTRRSEGSGLRIYEFQEDASVRLDLTQVFSKRSALRVRPREHIPVLVRVPDTDFTVSASLYDLSRSGLAFLLDRDEGALLEATWLKLAFQLPESDLELSLASNVRHRMLVGSMVQYGTEFDPARTVDFEEQEERIIHYVLEHQREQIRIARDGQ